MLYHKKGTRIKKVLGLIICMTVAVSRFGCGKEKWEGPALHKQELGTKTISNSRQLGGYPAADGKHIKDGVLLRSGALSDASDGDIEKLKAQYGLCAIIDMRTTEEVTENPDPVIEGVKYYHLPLMEKNDESEDQSAIVEIYRQHGNDPGRAFLEMIRAGALSEEVYTGLFNSKSALTAWRQFFDILLEQEGTVLWHCTGGKDRAGITTAILLSVLGVDRETIVADFTMTNEVFGEKIAYITAQASKHTSDPKELEQVGGLVGVPVEYIQLLFDRAKAEYGSMEAFARQKIGLTDEEISALRNKYLE